MFQIIKTRNKTNKKTLVDATNLTLSIWITVECKKGMHYDA